MEHEEVISELSRWCIRHFRFYGDYALVRRTLKKKGYRLLKTSKTGDYISPRRSKIIREICSVEQYFGIMKNFQEALIVTRMPNKNGKASKEYWMKIKGEEKNEAE